MLIYLTLLVAVIGLIIYLAAKNNADAKHIGDVLFWTGTLAFLLVWGSSVVHIGR